MNKQETLIVIGLVGAKGAGKNTFAKVLRDRYEFIREGALADRLKDACAEAFYLPREAFDDPAQKERYVGSLDGGRYYFGPAPLDSHRAASIIDSFGFQPTDANVNPHIDRVFYTPRQIAQYVGTEVLRALSPDVHCLGLMKDQPQSGVLVVTDIRFPNELAFFMNRYGTNFFPVYVSNDKAEAKAASDAHESERHVLDIAKSCRRIDNNGSLEDLERQAVNFIDGVLSQYLPESLGAGKKKSEVA